MAAAIPQGRTQKHRRLGRNNKKKAWKSKPMLAVVVLILVVLVYFALMAHVAIQNPAIVGGSEDQEALIRSRTSPQHHQSNKIRSTLEKPGQFEGNSKHKSEDETKSEGQSLEEELQQRSIKGPRGGSNKSRRTKSAHGPKSRKNAVSAAQDGSKRIPPKPKINKSLPIRDVRRPMWMANPKGYGVKPQILATSDQEHAQNGEGMDTDEDANHHPDPEHVLKAFVEPIDFDEWEEKPLPVRQTATADQLFELSYPELNSCKVLPEKIPADEYPDQDTFLPWVHDVFPTHDGKYIQFVAQNRRRCRTGNTPEEIEALHLTQPNIALFQHVPVKRVKMGDETRYQLTTHEDADPDGIATRFICRFKPGMEETLSVFNFDYDYLAYRKRNTASTFEYEDGGIKSVHLSQFLFRCPVPEHLIETVRSGDSVKDDRASLFVDVIPIRTPPRYGRANQFFQPMYNETLAAPNLRFDAKEEWGENHLLPRIEDSGRWENFPICRPSLQEYYSEEERSKAVVVPSEAPASSNTEVAPKMHRLVSCMWASAGYTTRGERFAINDGQRRMLEWIHYNKLLGFDHFYLYDNSYAFSSEATLKPIADLFPKEVTYIKWPFQVCNNNPNNVDSPGERSSQYAAESSCRLRFGPHTEWIGQFDMDEYLIPMGSYTGVLPILDRLDRAGTKILSFGSWRAWPRRDLIQKPVPIRDRQICDHYFSCFELQVPLNRTMLQTYNCDRQSGPKKDVMPAEKQLYRPDYVRQHFIHYSSVTTLSMLNRTEFEKAGYHWTRTPPFPDPASRFSDEVNEATMLHTKAIARQDTAGWMDVCKVKKYGKGGTCRIGVPYPQDYDEARDGEGNAEGWAYNCYINRKTEDHWVPLLEEAIQKEHGHIFDNIDTMD